MILFLAQLTYRKLYRNSGGHPSLASQDARLKMQELFKALNEFISQQPRSSAPLSILPGSGISATALPPLLDLLLPLGLTQIHLSGSSWIEPEDLAPSASARKSGMGMGAVLDESGEDAKVWGILRTDAEKVREVRRIADEMWRSWKESQVEGN